MTTLAVGFYQQARATVDVPITEPTVYDYQLAPNAYEQSVNRHRADNNLAPLTTSQLLMTSACAKAQDLINRNYFAHDTPDGQKFNVLIDEVNYQYNQAGENLASGFIDADETVQGWIDSPKHNDNLLGDYEQQAICAIEGDFMGSIQTVTVQHLATPKL